MPHSLPALTVLAFLLAAVPVEAQKDDASFEFSVFAGHSFSDIQTIDVQILRRRFGPSIFLDVSSRSFSQGFHIGVRFGYRIHRRTTIEVAYRYAPNNKLVTRGRLFPLDVTEPVGRLPNIDLLRFQSSVSEEIDSHALNTNLLYQLSSTRLAPFLAVGIGAEMFDVESGRNRTHFTWNLGGGIKWRLRAGLGVRVDVREVFLTDFFVTGKTENSTEVLYGFVIGF